jgi:hypothetical protein
MYADVVGQHSRYDRLLERIERIEKRLDLGSSTEGKKTLT